MFVVDRTVAQAMDRMTAAELAAAWHALRAGKAVSVRALARKAHVSNRQAHGAIMKLRKVGVVFAMIERPARRSRFLGRRP